MRSQLLVRDGAGASASPELDALSVREHATSNAASAITECVRDIMNERLYSF
jgi:hypothetical protein